MQPLASGILLDDRCGAAIGQELAQSIAVIGGIAQKRFGRRQRLHERGRRAYVVAISSGQIERNDPPLAVDDSVDLGRPPAPAAPDGLLLVPPFPPAAQRWAFAVVLSIH
jgi:hypothetical protein